MFENYYGFKREQTHYRVFARIFQTSFPSGNTGVLTIRYNIFTKFGNIKRLKYTTNMYRQNLGPPGALNILLNFFLQKIESPQGPIKNQK